MKDILSFKKPIDKLMAILLYFQICLGELSSITLAPKKEEYDCL